MGITNASDATRYACSGATAAASSRGSSSNPTVSSGLTHPYFGASLALVGDDAAGAFVIATGSRDAALLLQFMPGRHTVARSDRDSTEGIGLIEVYHVE